MIREAIEKSRGLGIEYRVMSAKEGGRIGIQAPARKVYCPNFIEAIEMVKKKTGGQEKRSLISEIHGFFWKLLMSTGLYLRNRVLKLFFQRLR